MNETTFLFGAGADSLYKICEGSAFAAALLQNQYYKERKRLLKGDVGRYELIYSGSVKVFLQTIENFPDEAKKALGEDVVRTCIAYYNAQVSEEEKKLVKDKCANWYKRIKEYKVEDKDDEAEFFMDKAVFFDAIDEKFNSLRRIPLNTKAKKVVNTYVSIFILMLNKLYNIPDDFEWSYENIIDLLCKPYDRVNLSEESYYSILKENCKNYNIVTTNYTDIAEIVTEKEVVYLHGNLKWFEDYKRLTVYDCAIDSEREQIVNNDNVFPFILIPSGVKPLICKKQLEMFSRFNKHLKNSNKLYVVGYKFNSEDNHINALIADWLREKDSELIYFNFENNCDIYGFDWCDVEIKKKITVININRDNSLKVFKDVLGEI